MVFLTFIFFPSFVAARAHRSVHLRGPHGCCKVRSPPTHATEQQKQQLLATSECTRAHGVSGFPDPITAATPPSSLQDYSIAEGIGDLWLLVPSTIKVNSPAFRQASDACKFH
jgi:hypothetical protein